MESSASAKKVRVQMHSTAACSKDIIGRAYSVPVCCKCQSIQWQVFSACPPCL